MRDVCRFAPARRLTGVHAGLGQARACAVHVVGTEAQVPEVDLSVVGEAQLDLQSRRGADCGREGVKRASTTMPDAPVKRSTCASRSAQLA